MGGIGSVRSTEPGGGLVHPAENGFLGGRIFSEERAKDLQSRSNLRYHEEHRSVEADAGDGIETVRPQALGVQE